MVVLYGHLWFRSWRRITGFQPFRVVFNASNVVLCCQFSAWLAHRIHLVPLDPAGSGQELVKLVAVMAAYFVLNSALAAAALALLQSDRSLVRLVGSPSENLLELATLCMGAIATLFLSLAAPLIVLVLLPLYALHRSVLVRQLEEAAMADPKTGLLNAVSWSTMAKKAIERARRDGTSVSVLMIDVDYFKRINDRYGHLIGDRVLIAVANTLRDQTRSYDLCGRFGGEEFVILLWGAARDPAVDVADRIRDRVHRIEVEDVADLSVSIGVADFPQAADHLEALLLGADNALYVAKKAGRDQVRTVESS
nr:GGDEF domain-containing protein [Kibdelosporangium sp. MJ126-NF4]